MTHSYTITGMTCNSCVTRVRSELLKLGDITSADVGLAAPQATLTMQQHIPLPALQSAIDKAGPYTIRPAEGTAEPQAEISSPSTFSTYKPVLLIGAYITIATALGASRNGWSMEVWMSDFMAAFFLVFSFFKLLDLRGFAASYAGYDLLARRWPAWGFIYPFVELALGLAFLARIDMAVTSMITLAVMGTAIAGVIRSLSKGRTIACACLGTVFNLPMSTITLVEDAVMIVMSAFMIRMA